MSLNFGEVLQRAWQITWKFKVLWIFGILASCGQGGGNSSNYQSDNNDFGNIPGMERAADWFTPGIIAALIGFVCIVWIVIMFLNTIGRIGLIRGTLKAERGAESLGFGELFSESMPYFWRFFWLQLLIGLPVFLFAMFIAVAVIAGAAVLYQGSNADAQMASFVLVPLLLCCGCVVALIAIVLNFIGAQAQNAIVLEEKGVMESLRRGWEVIKRNLGNLIVMGIILFVIGFVIGLIIAIPIFIVVLPAFASMALMQSENYTPLIFAFACLCLYSPILLVANGMLQSFVQTSWTLTYMRVTNYQPSAPDTSEPPLVVSDPLA
jgi:hypothetical protein